MEAQQRCEPSRSGVPVGSPTRGQCLQESGTEVVEGAEETGGADEEAEAEARRQRNTEKKVRIVEGLLRQLQECLLSERLEAEHLVLQHVLMHRQLEQTARLEAA
jgi:hypothetical protein